MKQWSIFWLVLLLVVKVNAGEVISISKSAIKVKEATSQTFQNILNSRADGFSVVEVKGYDTEKTVGAPELPVKNWLLKGTPEQIQVALNVRAQEILENVKPAPVQEEECRCETDKLRTFQYNAKLYQRQPAYTLDYLGTFRGTPITRLSVRLASYNAAQNSVAIKTQLEVDYNVSEFSFEAGDYRDYLIVTTQSLKNGLDEFVVWKQSQGYNVHVEVVSAPTVESIKALVRQHYDAGVDFVIFVGDENTIPMHYVNTSGSYRTPSDLYYFTMDGSNDFIPEMFYSRIVATDAAQVASQLNKASEYEQKSMMDISGYSRIIGIASNEGYNPSDDQYVRGIEQEFKSALHVEATHFAQNDAANSNPEGVNRALDQGAFWLTYMGHGSGTAWASTNKWYTNSDIVKLNNRNQVKPIIIDVACMNGVLKEGYFGQTFMKTATVDEQNPFGAAAYYGGTVNISWHPPAVMARGIAKEHMAKRFKHLGEALLAGQLYLSQKWNSQSAVIDNFEWYHLQGDPGMNIQY